MTKKTTTLAKLFDKPSAELLEIILYSHKDLNKAPELLSSVISHAGMCSFACSKIEDKEDIKSSQEMLLKHANDLKVAVTTIKHAPTELQADKTIVICPFKKHPSYSKIEPLLNDLSAASDEAVKYADRELSDEHRSTKSSGSNPANPSPKKSAPRFKFPFSG